MVEANKAYALGDEARLPSILDAWENSPRPSTAAVPTRFARASSGASRRSNVRTMSVPEDVAALHDSPLAKLKEMVDEVAARGEDLV